jgi:hypothetical protein
VLLFKRIQALALGFGLLSTGCVRASQTALGSLEGLAAGTTTLRVSNHVGAPGELDGVTITVDRQALPLSSVPPDGAAPATVASLHLAPGPHSIAVRARSRWGVPSNPLRGSEVIVIGAQQPFLVQHGPAAITIDVRSAASDLGTATPVAVTLTILGGRMAPEFGVAPSDDKDERCTGLLPIPRALCRAAVDLDEATRQNDVVAALCVHDKLLEMRKLAIIGETGEGDSIRMAEAQVTQLSRRVELCAGDILATPAPEGLTVTPPQTR